jgi:(1->4)-alpha-D-glucan 1-alpha-D-glucosylmutase
VIATYRLQLTPDFGFADARAILAYLQGLGISHLYLSPVTEARQGSTHGYDVTDHNALRAELGGAAQFLALLQEAERRGMRLLLDIVPNHAGLGPRNRAWQDTLAYGPHSPYARFFDIAWKPLKPELHNKVLLPFLGQSYGEVLEAGQVRIVYEDGALYAAYFDHRFALGIRGYASVLRDLSEHRVNPRLRRLAAAYEACELRARDHAEALRHELGTILLPQHVERYAPTAATLHALLDAQFWRLAHWRCASHEINYRRFFEINDLIGLRMEDDHVFQATHRLLSELLAHPAIDGVRVDHVDGLLAPEAYLTGLRELGARRVWVEKILAADEALPASWPVEGTTGYEFGADVVGLFTYRPHRRAMTRVAQRFVPRSGPFGEEVLRSKRMIMTTKLAGELERLAHELDRMSEGDFHTRDFTRQTLRDALVEIIAVFPRYRTYLPHGRAEARTVIDTAVARATAHNREIDPSVYAFIGEVLMDQRPRHPARHAAWVGRFQQYTAPVTAKGLEDTAFYRDHRLCALNEVGGDPATFGTSARRFHARARARAACWPGNLLATSTHDSKRGEDLRMRLLVLSELPDDYRQALRALLSLSRPHRTGGAPSRRDMLLFFQTLLGLWAPGDSSLPPRLAAYMQKASREAKCDTSWTNPDAAYEEALERFVRGVLGDPGLAAAVGPLADRLARFGLVNSVSQVLLKATSPGVPDFYRGCEHLDLSLVDPDNRRPVDFAARQGELLALAPWLAAARGETLPRFMEADPAGAKLFVTARALAVRRAHAALFREGAYLPLPVTGPHARHGLAYARRRGDEACIVWVPRFSALLDAQGVARPDASVALPPRLQNRAWQDALSGERLSVSGVLTPAALPLSWAVLLPS